VGGGGGAGGHRVHAVTLPQRRRGAHAAARRARGRSPNARREAGRTRRTAPGISGATWHDFAGDRQTRRAAAPDVVPVALLLFGEWPRLGRTANAKSPSGAIGLSISGRPVRLRARQSRADPRRQERP
jgi:hypothetical protein